MMARERLGPRNVWSAFLVLVVKSKSKKFYFKLGFYNKYQLKPQAFATDYNNRNKINNIMIK